MLSDHEQRALEELERWYGIDAQEPVRAGRRARRSARRTARRSARRPDRPAGFRTVLVLAVVSLGLLLGNVPVAGFALALATAMSWTYWRLWAHRTGDGSMPAPPWLRGRHGPPDVDSRPAAPVRQYLRWLAQQD